MPASAYSYETRRNVWGLSQSRLKSSHLGFLDSTNATRFARVQGFDFFLTIDRITYIFEDLEIDEAIDVVSSRETGDQLLFMFVKPASDIVGHDSVKSAGRLSEYM